MPYRLAGRLGVTPNEIFDEQWNIRGSLAERWHHNRNNIESVEKILTEGSGSDGIRQIPIRSCYQTDVYRNRLVASHSLKLALLEHAQECDLSLHRKIADFIKEECPSVSGLKPSYSSLQSTREGAFLVSEKLRGNQRLGDGGAVHAYEGSRRAVRSPMEGASYQFLARSGFAQDQNGRIRWRDFCHLLQHLTHRFARTDDLLKHRETIDFFAQHNVLVLEALLSQLAILDVCSRCIPAHEASLFVAERVITTEEPTILAVFPENPPFGLKRNTL